MIINILGNCVKTREDIGLSEPVVEEFDYTVTVPTDYETVTLPAGTFDAWLRYNYIVPGRWIVSFEVTSGSFIVDYNGDDAAREVLGFAVPVIIRVGDYLVGFELTVPGEEGLIYNIEIDPGDPYRATFTPDGPKSIDISFSLLNPVSGCFPTTADLPNQQLLIHDYPVPVVVGGIEYNPQDYGWPATITIQVTGELIERAT